MQADDGADDDEGGGFDADGGGAVVQGGERAGDDALTRGGALLDDGGGRGGVGAVGQQPVADLREGLKAHVDNQGLLGIHQPVPGHGAAQALAGVAGDEDHGLGMVAMGQWNAGVSGAAAGGGDAGDDLEGDALLHQCFDLLAAAAEDEGIAPLEPHHALAFAGQPDQQPVDLVLRQRVLAARLAGVDARGIDARQAHDIGRYEAVVDDDIGFLERSQSLEGKQIRIAGAGPDQGNETHACVRPSRAFGGEQALELAPGLVVPAGEDQFRQPALQAGFPEAPTAGPVGYEVLDAPAAVFGEPGQAAIGGRQGGLQARPHQPGQHRRGAAGGDRDHDRRAVDDGGEEEGAEFRAIDDIDGDPVPASGRGDGCVDLAPVGGGNDQAVGAYVVGLEALGHMPDAPVGDHGREIGSQFGREHGHPAIGPQQGVDLARGDLAPAHDQRRLAGQLQEDRQELHGQATGAAGATAGEFTGPASRPMPSSAPKPLDGPSGTCPSVAPDGSRWVAGVFWWACPSPLPTLRDSRDGRA